MDFNEFLDKAWEEHGDKSQEVAARLEEGMLLVRESSQILALAHLILHVCGEHLGNWDLGLGMLTKLSQHELISGDAQAAITRSAAALNLAKAPEMVPAGFSSSDLARVYALAAAARSGQGDMQLSKRLLVRALEVAAALSEKDPAQRALAVAGNNLAVGLEQKATRSQDENELMVFAATVGLEKWKLAGGWLEASRAEYRLAKSMALAGRKSEALEPARSCVRICYENSAGPLDMFFAFEVMSYTNWINGREKDARENLAMATEQFSKLSEADQPWAEKDFENLKKLLA